MWRHLAVGVRRPLGLGCGVSTPRRGTTDAQSSPRAKKRSSSTCIAPHDTESVLRTNCAHALTAHTCNTLPRK